MDAPTFRGDFPEFSDMTVFPDSRVTFWIGIATQLINADQMGDLTNFGIELLTAHNLTLSAQAAKAAAIAGGIPGQSAGITSSKSVADVSVGYDTSVASVDGGGNFNLTTYGTRYLEFAMLFGAGGVQI